MARTRLHLNLFIHARGHHEAAWRHPLATRRPLTDLGYYAALARTAEAGLLDSLFLADILTLGIGEASESSAAGGLEPITLLAALAGATTRIGLIGTASTTYMEPFNLARQFASLDHLSGGRAGWNIVTSWAPGAERQFGQAAQPAHADRYARAEEFVQVALALWDSWADDAILDDPAAGRFADAARIRRIDHAGEHYRVAGPLNIPRPPQGRPVLVQAGSSDTGRRFAARHAEAVFTAHLERETAIAFRRDLKALARAEGRDPDQVLVLPGLSAVIGATEAEALRIERELNALTDPEVGRARLSGRFGGHDFSHLPLDRPTLRQLLQRLAGARGHFCMAGTPEQVADMMEDWFRAGAADGFNLMPPVLPAMLDVFVAEVVPILQRRGLFRTDYEGPMLRDQYGLARPARSAPRLAAE